MANGDAAAAAGMAVLNGTEDRRNGWDEINKSRDYIAQRTSTVQPVAKGGTGATTAAAARTNLGVAAVATETDVNAATFAVTPNALMRRDSVGRVGVATPTAAAHAATKAYVDARDQVTFEDASQFAIEQCYPWNGGIVNGQWRVNSDVIVQNVISNVYALTHPVSTGYSSLYVNSDGRYGATPSALRFKQDIIAHEYTLEQLELIAVCTYRLRTAVESLGDDAPREVGVIAEQLLEAGLSEFVIFNAAGETQSVAYERLVLVAIGAVKELAGMVRAQGARQDALEARIEALEGASA